LSDFDRIREAHGSMVWSVVFRILKHQEDALDCFQDVFSEAIVRSRRSPVGDWGALLRWLATHRAIDHLRRRQRSAAGDDVDQLCDRGPSVEQQATFAELVERVRKELACLPEQQAEAFWLVCVENRAYEEVARLMGVPRSTVGVLVHRARQHMRTRLSSFHIVPSE
jgi:RNA polymerase sigma-70 factor (ECF subfamily)